MAVVLSTDELSKQFGQVVVARDISMQIESGERVGIIGPNGAGKTTFVNLITAQIQPDSGRIYFLGDEITGLTPRQITRKGVVRSFQMAQLFSTMTVRENLLMALASREQVAWQIWKRLYQSQREAEADDLLQQFGLVGVARQSVNELSEGELKLLDVALSLALKPRLLIMDEPTSGVSSDEKYDIMDILIETVQAAGITLLFIEHDLEVVRQYAERVLVFVDGTIMDSGSPDEVLADRDSLQLTMQQTTQQTMQEDRSNR